MSIFTESQHPRGQAGKFTTKTKPGAGVGLSRPADGLASDAGRLSRAVQDSNRQCQDALGRVEALSAGVCAQLVSGYYPDAAHLVLEPSDQGFFWSGEAILDRAGGEVGSLGEEELLDTDEDLALSNLNCFKSYPYISQDAQGQWAMDLEAARSATPALAQP